jgi:aryl-alcohol dehydrogenase-like predicted oxidoreductase
MEKKLGKAIRLIGRDNVVVATKGGSRRGLAPGQGFTDLSRKALRASVDNSLRRLGMEYIDLYQLHAPDPDTPLTEVLATLDDLVRQGKVLYVGCCNTSVAYLTFAQELCRVYQWEQFISVQAPYNLLQREAEQSLLVAAMNDGVGVVAYGSLMGGLLTASRRPGVGLDRWDNLTVAERAAAEHFTGACKRRGLQPSAVALAWVLRRPEIAVALVGAGSPTQIRENVEAVSLNLTHDEWAGLEAELYPDGRHE